MLRSSRLVLAFACLSLFACPSKPVTPADGGPPPDSGTPDSGTGDAGQADAGTLDDLCQPRWQTLCDAWSTCDSAAPYFPINFSSVSDCVAKGVAQCKRFLSNPLPAGPILTPEAAIPRFLACTAAMTRANVCDRYFDYVAGYNSHIDPDCMPLGGTLANGTGCYFGDQCQSGFCKFQGACGVCANQGDVGAACQFPQECRLGRTCVQGACALVLPADAGCDGFSACDHGFACIAGHCAPQLAEGASCVVNAPPACKLGQCNAGHCKSYLTDAGAGGFCGLEPGTNDVSACSLGSACTFVNPAYQGVCVGRAKVGDRCFFDNGFQGSQCEIFAQCANGVCTNSIPEPTCGQDGGAHPARRDGGILPPRTPTATEVSEANRQRTLLCDAAFACPRLAGYTAYFFGSRANCDAVLDPIGTTGIAAPRSGASNDVGCNDALAALSPCDLVDSLFGGKTLPAACDPAGTVGTGGVCENTRQCAAGSRCNAPIFPTSAICGVCSVLRGAGEKCVGNADCQRGLACGQGHCLAGAALGATCSTSAPCNPDLFCVAGTCSAPLEPDAGCTPNAGTCAGGTFCNLLSSKCELLQIAGADGGVADAGLTTDGGLSGTPCGILAGQLVFCPYGFNCHVTNAATNTGVCDSAKGLGEPCTWNGGLDGRGGCRFPGSCRDGFCTFHDPTYCQ